jgi:hypothetical protein
MPLSRRRFLISASAAVLAASPAMAQDDAATRSVIRQLERQGFEIISVRRTLLGRVRVLSRRGNLQREIVLDPRNGAILRDYTVDAGGTPRIGPSPDEEENGGVQGAHGYDDDYDDDDDDSSGSDSGSDDPDDDDDD